MKKIILLSVLLISSLSFTIDTKTEIYDRIAREYDTENEGIKIYEKKEVLYIEGPRGVSKIFFEGENVEKILITHKVKYENVDKPLIENLLLNTGYFINEKELVNSKLTDENYLMEINIRLSNHGMITKILDIALVSRTYGLLYDNGREKLLTFKINRK